VAVVRPGDSKPRGVLLSDDKRKRLVFESLQESDSKLRELERAVAAAPGDLAALLNLRFARIRTGLPAWNEMMATALGQRPIILHANGKLQRVAATTDWLIKNARDHDSFVVEDLGKRAMLRCLMQNGRWYETPFADPNHLWDWLNRPSFRGSDLDWMGFKTIVGGPRPPGVKAYKSHEVEAYPRGGGYRRVR